MHILFLTDNFPPEGNAPASRTYEHAKEWVSQGEKVSVITCAPNFPDGVIFPGYKNRWLVRERIDGINVWRVKTFITQNNGFLKRILDYMSFMFSSFIFGIFTKKVDIVIGTSPQFFTTISAWAIAKIKRVPFVFELRDIWPASISAVGAMQNNLIISLLEKIELFLYHQAHLIISVTSSFKEDLIHRGVSKEKIKVVFNGVDLQSYKPKNKKNDSFVKKYDLKNKFVIGYIGTHGLAHALDKVIETAELLKYEKNIHFVFAGSGAEKNRLITMTHKKNLSNVTFIPRQDKKNMKNLWSICDVSLISLKNTKLFSTVIPSKIFESMAMGLPIIISAPKGEATSIIEQNKCGLIVKPESPINLVNSINSLYISTIDYDIFKLNSLKTAKKYERRNLAIRMLKIIKNI